MWSPALRTSAQCGDLHLLEAIGRLQPHDHLCLIYETPEEQFAAVVPYMRIGLERGERCFYIVDDNTAESVLEAMNQGGVDTDLAIRSGALRIVTKSETYLREGRFDPDRMIEFFGEAVAAARAAGFSAMRVTGEMTWALGSEPGTERLIEYEAKLNRFFATHDALALCQYNRKRFSPLVIRDVIRTHPVVVFDFMVCRNFYYVPPEEFLAPDAAAREADRLLGHIREREVAERLLANHELLENFFSSTHHCVALLDRDQLENLVKQRTEDLSEALAALKAEGEQRRQVEAAVRENEARLCSMVDAITESAFLMDPEGTVLACNQSVAARLGCGISELLGKNIYERLPAEVAERRRKYVEQVIASGRTVRFEDERLGRIIDQCLYPVIGQDGKVSAIAVFGQDVTDRKRAERHLRESREQYRRIVETANDGIWSLDVRQATTFVNERMAESLGYTVPEMIARPVTDFMFTEDLPDHETQMRKRQSGASDRYERRFRHKDGSERWMLVSATALMDDDGRFAGSFGMFTDITDRKRAEQSLERSTRLLDLIRQAQSLFIAQSDPETVFGSLLQSLVSLTDSQYGFLDEVVREEDGQVFKRNLALTNISWDEDSRRLYDQLRSANFEFRNLNNLSGAPATSGRLVIANDPGRDSRSGGLPPGHPPVNAFMGIPMYFGGELVGVAGVANRPGGYDENIAVFLEPFVSTCAAIIHAVRNRRTEQAHLETIRESERRFHLAMEATNEGLWDWDIRHDRIYRNPRFFTMLGYEIGAIAGSFGRWVDLLHPEDRELALRTVDEYLHSGRNRFELEFRMRAKSGQWRWILSRGEVVERDSDGQPLRMVGTHVDITDRKEAEKELQRLAHEWQVTFDAVGDAVWLLDADCRILRGNKASVSLLGRDPSEVVGRPCWELVHGTAEPPCECPFRRIQQSLRRESEELPVGDRWCRVTVDPIVDADGKLAGAVHVISDMSERKKKDQELEVLRVMASRVAACQDIAGMIEVVEQETDRFLPSDAGFFAVRPPDGDVLQILHSVDTVDGEKRTFPARPWSLDDSSEILAALLKGESVLLDRDSGEHEVSGFRRFGDESRISRSLMFVPIRSGDSTIGVLSLQSYNHLQYGEDHLRVLRRIADLVAPVVERTWAQEELRESEARFRSYFQLPLIGVAISSPEKAWVEVNDRVCGILGYSREELARMTWAELTHPDDLDADVREFERMLAGEIDQYAMEKRFLRKDGVAVETDLAVGCVRRDDGAVDYVVALIEDITERKQAAAERQRLEELLRQSQKLEALGQLAAGVAHDFNNMLTVIRGQTHMAYAAAGRDNQMKEHLRAIEDAVSQSMDITKSLLTFSRRMPTDKKPIQLGEVVQDARRLLKHALPARIHVVTEIEPACDCTVMADRTQIYQVLLNLAINARDAMPRGGTLRLGVATAVIPEGSARSLPAGTRCVRLSVSDTGTGIEPGLLPRIFDPFFTTKDREQGSGLGLSLVHGIVTDHEGYIEVESEVGKGTTFTITLPSLPLDEESPSDSAGPASNGTGELVLVAGPDAFQAGAVGGYLQSVGYRVLLAEDEDQVLEHLEKHGADVRLVILRADIPHHGGPECVRKCRKMLRGLPAILLSCGLPLSDDAAGENTLVIDGPVVLGELARLAREALGLKERTRQ